MTKEWLHKMPEQCKRRLIAERRCLSLSLQPWCPCLILLALNSTTVAGSCAPLLWLLPGNWSSSNPLCRSLKPSAHPHSKPSFTCLAWVCFNLLGVLCQHIEREFTGNAGGRTAAFLCCFVRLLVDKTTVWVVSHLLSVSFSSPTFQRCSLHQAVLVSVSLCLLCWIGSITQKRVHRDTLHLRQHRTDQRSACVVFLVTQRLSILPHSLHMAEFPSETSTLHLLFTLQNNLGT